MNSKDCFNLRLTPSVSRPIGMAQGYSAATPYVTFGSAGGMGGFPNENSENNGEMPAPPEMNEGTVPGMPDGEFPPQMQENENGEADPQTPGNGERPERPAKSGEASVTAEEQEATAAPAIQIHPV